MKGLRVLKGLCLRYPEAVQDVFARTFDLQIHKRTNVQKLWRSKLRSRILNPKGEDSKERPLHVIESGRSHEILSLAPKRNPGRTLPPLPTLDISTADSSTHRQIYLRLSSTTTTLPMALKQNIRQAEGILRSVPDPGQIVYDPPSWSPC